MATDDKTMLQVSNLDPEANEYMLNTIFAPFGQIKGLSVIRNPVVAENYAFIDYMEPNAANMALTSMNKIKFLERELNISFANYGGQQTNAQQQSNAMTTRGHHIYVGDLSDNIDDKAMRDHFTKFGPILDAKIVRNNDNSSRGYGFIAFENEDDATEAIRQMDRSWLVNKAIRVNWATRKTDQLPDYGKGYYNLERKNYDEVYKETSLSNTTVYCGGLLGGITEDLIRAHFMEFGRIVDIKIYAEKAFAFVRFDTHEAASKAIVTVHGKKINGYFAKCSWGKDQTAMAVASQIAAAQYNMQNLRPNPPLQQPMYGNVPPPQFGGGSAAGPYYGGGGGVARGGYVIPPQQQQQFYGVRPSYGGGGGFGDMPKPPGTR